MPTKFFLIFLIFIGFFLGFRVLASTPCVLQGHMEAPTSSILTFTSNDKQCLEDLGWDSTWVIYWTGGNSLPFSNDWSWSDSHNGYYTINSSQSTQVLYATTAPVYYFLNAGCANYNCPGGVFYFEGNPNSAWGYFTLYRNDTLGFYQTISLAVCSTHPDWYSCQNDSCCWYEGNPQLYPFGAYCVDCPSGTCGSGLDCQNCLSTTSCEAFSTCYWADGRCKLGTGTCGESVDLQFCTSSDACASADGYWYDNFCWLSPKTQSPTTWEDYYAAYGDYATPTAWISDLAGGVGDYLGKVGGFITTFSDKFDLNEANYRGKILGSIVPKARSYLNLLNGFFGTLPFGDYFIYTLIFVVAVGVFRLAVRLFPALKFW